MSSNLDNLFSGSIVKNFKIKSYASGLTMSSPYPISGHMILNFLILSKTSSTDIPPNGATPTKNSYNRQPTAHQSIASNNFKLIFPSITSGAI